jgi:PPOX class probable F420-dependent enzyme
VIPPAAETFLRAHTRTFLVSVRPDGAPACHPMVALWHEGALYMTTYRKSAKARNVMREPRVACVVVTDDEAPRMTAVVVRGRAEILPAGSQMPWAATPAPRVAGAGVEVGREVAAKLAEGKRVVMRVVADSARVVEEPA